MRGQLRFFVVASALSLGLLAAGVAGGIAPPTLRVVVLGDSFTAALDLETFQDDASLSWATGTRLGSPSIAQRLEDEGWDVQATNLATSGHRARDLEHQLVRAPQRADVVIVWIGTNDLCTPSLTAAQFQVEVRDAFGKIDGRYPDAQVLVFAPPSLPYIGRQQQASPQAVRMWSEVEVCTHFFGDARAAGAGADRQARFERAIETAAAENGFHHSTSLQKINRPLSAWADWDYLHPSPQGSALFADRAWPDVLHVVGSGSA